MSVRSEAFVVAFAVLGISALPVQGGMTTLGSGVSYNSSPSAAPAAKPAAAPPTPSATGNAAVSPGAGSAPTKSAKPGSPKSLNLVGTVIYAKGGRVVAEIRNGAKVTERFRVYDQASRPRGEARAAKALDAVLFVLEPVGSVSADVGDRLARLDP